MYHSIATSTTDEFRDLTVDPVLFAEQIGALADESCRFVRFADIPAALQETTPVNSPIVAITVDDGLADFVSGALPTLVESKASATLFTPTAYVGKTTMWMRGDDGQRPVLGWQDLRDLVRAGFEVGSHGHAHLAADVNTADVVCSDARRSKSLLEDQLGIEVTSFAYPFGQQTRRSRRAIRQAGFLQACSTLGLPALPDDDRMALPRLHVGPSTTPADLADLIVARPSRVQQRWIRGKQQVWLSARQFRGRRALGARSAATKVCSLQTQKSSDG
jgi:peptidoglycan/xylan/chitin deacetylase (PgdA/CDA1 family)